jgi:glutathione S-transferase
MKVRFLLAELGLRCTRRHVPFAYPRPDWYIDEYPFGTVPFLRDGDLALGESNAILRYLATREGRIDLYPSDRAARSRVDWALDAWSIQLRPGFYPAEQVGLLHGDLLTGGGRAEDADQNELAKAIDKAIPKLDLMERFVARNGTVTGSFTIADIAVAPVLWRWQRLPLPFDPWPSVKLLRETVTARPAFQSIGLVV